MSANMFTLHETGDRLHTNTCAHTYTHAFTFIIILLYVQFQQVDRKCTIMKSMEDEILSNQTDWKYKMVYLSTHMCVLCACVFVWTYQRIIRTAYADQLFHNICNSFSLSHWFYCRITKCMLVARSPHSHETTATAAAATNVPICIQTGKPF